MSAILDVLGIRPTAPLYPLFATRPALAACGLGAVEAEAPMSEELGGRA